MGGEGSSHTHKICTHMHMYARTHVCTLKYWQRVTWGKDLCAPFLSSWLSVSSKNSSSWWPREPSGIAYTMNSRGIFLSRSGSKAWANNLNDKYTKSIQSYTKCLQSVYKLYTKGAQKVYKVYTKLYKSTQQITVLQCM